MKHFYETIPGYFTWPDFYRWLVARLPSYSKGVEVGTCNGTSLAFLGVEIYNSGRPITVEGVDLDNHNGHAAANLAPLGKDAPRLISGCSWEVAAKYEDGSLDFVFIDGDHSFESVSKDIAAWLPKVRPGGIIAGHDYSAPFPGVMRAVAEAFSEWNVHRGERYPGAHALPLGEQYFPVWWKEVA